MSVKEVNKKIAELILRAQNASDGGKLFSVISFSRKGLKDNHIGYKTKDACIAQAINLISKTGRQSAFRYFVTDDKTAAAYFMVYFETRVNGQKYQVSFHSYDNNLVKYVQKRHTKWDQKDSRDSAVIIYRHFVPNGQYASAYGKEAAF